MMILTMAIMVAAIILSMLAAMLSIYDIPI